MPSTSASTTSRPGEPAVFGQRQHRRGHRPRGMDDRLEVRVVEVEGVRGDAVDERGARHVELLAAAEHARLRRRLEHLQRCQRRLAGLVTRGADRAAEPVVEGAMRLVLDRIAPAARRMVGDELREDGGDRGRRGVGGDGGVAGQGVCSVGKKARGGLRRRVSRIIRRGGCCGPGPAWSSARCRRGCTGRTARASSARARRPRRRASRRGRAP